MKSGQRSYIPGIGPIHVQTVEPVALDELTPTDAVQDGFEKLIELKDALQSIYRADELETHQLYRVRFALGEPSKQEGAQAGG